MSATSQVTAAAFAEPFPLLICGDSAGFLSAFLVRPFEPAAGSSSGLQRYTRLLRWRNKPKHVWDLSPEDARQRDANHAAKQAAKLAR
jgi:hypothetical protein